MADKDGRQINSDYSHRMADLRELSKDKDAIDIANFMAGHQLEGNVKGMGHLGVEDYKLLLEWATELLSLMKDNGWRKG